MSLAAAAHLDFSMAGAGELQAGAHRLFSRQESRLRSLLAKLEEEERAAGEAGRWRQLGELLSANLHRVRRGQSRITVEDFHAEGEPRDIDLDPKLSPQENVALFFKHARRGERGLATISARREAVCTALDASRAAHVGTEPRHDWADALEAWPEAWRTSCPKTTEKLTPRALWAPGGPEWGAPSRGRRASEIEEKSHGPGRRYMLPGGWEVRVGRSNSENDELTHHFADADDVWMHASGAAGSHVVLRMAGRPGNPPREILEAAAAIAARFSKAKHSGTVPVIWTRKRHVRKPRGAKPGLAACTHEKTVFVRPGLPATYDESES
jgi:predicted ribosome quality control (RQC) complex YloA/Tae2 family protein